MATLADKFADKTNMDFSGREVWSKMHTVLVIPFSNIIKLFGGTDIPRSPIGDAAFIGKLIASNLVVSTVQSVGLALEAVVAEAMFLMGKFWYYKFLINPQGVTTSHAKLQSVEETSDMTVINTYRNQAPSLAFKGVSGCILPRDIMALAGDAATALPTETLARYPKMSTAWLKFRQLEKFYNEINSDIVVMYDMDIYIGKFVNFSFSQSADNPWLINYDMNIKVYPDMTLHTTSLYDYAPFFQAMLTRYGTSFAEDFEGKARRNAK